MTEIPKAYEPQAVETKWYDFWEQHGCFTADPARVSATRPAYSIVIPPPNVTGVLTMGHVLNNTVQDILARKARMDGKEVLWLPGTDHAGIATQNVVERTLKKAGEIKHRDDLGREALVAKIWEWREKYGGIILQQLRALGASCDWSRTRFTMDPEYSRCVQKVFVDLYKKGLIYRGKRMVNWCPASLTALSDEEVIMKEQRGFMYHFRVEVAESPGTFLTIATTRPETIPADTAVAVNPNDPRYQHLIGKHVYRALPLEVPKEERRIPIIADVHVDFEFGTGVLKVTPAHDKADYAIWERIVLKGIGEQDRELADMEPIEVIGPTGALTDAAGKALAGLDRFVARKKAAEILEAAGALEKAEPYVNNVGFSERADVPIEPRLSEQWFLKYPSVAPAQACVATGSAPAPGAVADASSATSGRVELSTAEHASTRPRVEGGAPSTVPGAGALPQAGMRFFPDRWAKVYDHWMTGIQDWCISRQIWWGHRIPVWRKRANHASARQVFEPAYQQFTTGNGWRVTRLDDLQEFDPGTFLPNLPNISGLEFEFQLVYDVTGDDLRWLEANGWTQDPDVLDTWFSSWLWPFATMRWTGDQVTDAKNLTLKKFYPTTDLVTGPDIIFFWVARMIMAGYEYRGDLPFRNVYFTGIIRDKQGRKMSKSLGNSPDPLDLIAKYGADALRFGVMRAAPLGQDVLFDEQSVELGRNFCNKLWNACRFRQMQAGPADAPAEIEGEINHALLTSDDKWILLRLDAAIREVTQAFDEYKFSDATATLYRFFWSEYCDWYVEASKAVLGSAPVAGAAPAASGHLESSAAGELPTRNGVEGEAPSTAPEAGALPKERDALRRNKIAVMDFALGHLLRLFHPFLPFITEELWHGLGYSQDLPTDQGGTTIMFARWPKPFSPEEREYFNLDDAADQVAQAKYDLVSLGRGLRRDCKIDPAKKVKFILRPARDLPESEVVVLRLLLNAESLVLEPQFQPAKGTPMAANELGELFLPLEGLVDVAAERARLTKELEKIQTEIGKVEAKLANPAFTEKVPAKVLEEHRQRLVDWRAKEKQVQAAFENLPA